MPCYVMSCHALNFDWFVAKSLMIIEPKKSHALVKLKRLHKKHIAF